jgi:hypothetical protein
MFKRIVTLVRGLMGCQSTDRSLLAVEQPSPNAKPLRVKSTQTSKAVQVPVKSSRTRKASPAPQTKAVKSSKAESKPALTTNGKRGRPRKTPVPPIPQAVKLAPKRKP